MNAMVFQDRGGITKMRASVEKPRQHRFAAIEINAFHRQQLGLGDETAGCGKPARLVAGGQNPMTRHDNRPGIAGHRRTDRLRRTRRARPLGEGPVGHRLATSHPPQGMIDRSLEGRDAGKIQSHLREVDSRAGGIMGKALRGISGKCGNGAPCPARALGQPRGCRGRIPVRQLHTQQSGLAPCDAADAKRRLEEHIFSRIHGTFSHPRIMRSKDGYRNLTRLAKGRGFPIVAPDRPERDVPLTKAEIRNERLALRDAIPAETRIEKSLAMADHAEALTFEPGTIISGFMPIRSEADVRPMMSAFKVRGARLCLPVVLDKETIAFRELLPTATLVDTGFGTRGPGPEAAELDPDILLVPLSAFDRQGNRIGYGAGHYDRAIDRLLRKGLKPRLIGIAFDVQNVEEIPAEPHDMPLDAILTESGLTRFR